MKVLRIDPKKPDKKLIILAAEAISAGKILIHPTDTVYGIGCRVDSDGVEKISDIKKRKDNKPFSIACSDLEMAKDYSEMGREEERFISENLDKPYTFVLKKKSAVPDGVTAGLETVGVRIPNQEVILEAIRAAGVPIISTSANISGDAAPAEFGEISMQVISKADVGIDSGRCRVGKPSTVIDLRTGKMIR